MASVPMPTPAPQPKEGEAPPEQPKTIAGLLGNMFGGSKAEAKPAAACNRERPGRLARQQDRDGAAKSKRDNPPSAPLRLRPKPRRSRATAQRQAASRSPSQRRPQPKAPSSRRAVTPRVDKQVETPRAPEREMRTAYSAAPPASSNGLLTGAQPVVPVGSFDSRFSGCADNFRLAHGLLRLRPRQLAQKPVT